MNLLSECASGGCGAKIGPDELAAVLQGLPTRRDPRLLVGFDTADDAAVYALSPEAAVVSTVDFFPPMVEDPELFGRIAAANALSDVYAMGGRPILALSLVGFPQRLDQAVLGRILAGGAAKVLEAGAILAGGHSIYDHEPKYGLAVTGLVDPNRIWRNCGGVVGDALILTKPLGVGLLLGAIRVGLATAEEFSAAAAAMERLNKYAAETAAGFDLHAVTDVTGFGLLGHAAEMAGEDRTLVFDFDSLPFLPGARGYAAEYLATAGGQRNRRHLTGRVDLGRLGPADQELLFDPQTSGGLLISLPMAQAAELRAALKTSDPEAAIVGQVEARGRFAAVML
ncbi:selenide, water dikinase SelD [Deltaproteobacteria bacterium]|nr:selenide, water dikinase SelD [Deltaproteobacteria bacterium]